MNGTWKIFCAVFSAGIVSLLLELSLLREFVYVLGSTAVSNSLIISFFLAGLAAGAYFGTWKRIQSKDEAGARFKFSLLQFLVILYILIFYATKEYFIYHCPSPLMVMAYFIVAAVIPSFIAGASYAATVEILYHKGQRYVTHIYAYSTIGSVVGGLLHGLVFVYFLGIQAAYAFAAFCSAAAILLVFPFRKSSHAAVFTLLSLLTPAFIQGDYLNKVLYPGDQFLFRENSPFGPVEVRRTKEGNAIQLTINNMHQYYSHNWDIRIHRQWAQTTLEIVNRPCEVLLLGYGSGVSSAAFLESNLVKRVDTIENASPVIEAGRRFFPKEHQLATTDRRSNIIIDDFRKFVRFTDRTYDIILLDHGILDPYYGGFFTLEFFDQLKKVLKPGGVVAMLGIGMNWSTTSASFKYIYTPFGLNLEPLILTEGYFLTQEEFDPRLAFSYGLMTKKPTAEPVYSDHHIRGLTADMMMKTIKYHLQRIFSLST